MPWKDCPSRKKYPAIHAKKDGSEDKPEALPINESGFIAKNCSNLKNPNIDCANEIKIKNK